MKSPKQWTPASLLTSKSFYFCILLLLMVLWAEGPAAAADGFNAAGGGKRVGALSSAGAGFTSLGNSIQACSRILGYLQGGFGTLVASAAGMGAIIASSLGGYKAAWGLFVVSLGTFILGSFLRLFLTGCNTGIGVACLWGC